MNKTLLVGKEREKNAELFTVIRRILNDHRRGEIEAGYVESMFAHFTGDRCSFFNDRLELMEHAKYIRIKVRPGGRMMLSLTPFGISRMEKFIKDAAPNLVAV